MPPKGARRGGVKYRPRPSSPLTWGSALEQVTGGRDPYETSYERFTPEWRRDAVSMGPLPTYNRVSDDMYQAFERTFVPEPRVEPQYSDAWERMGLDRLRATSNKPIDSSNYVDDAWRAWQDSLNAPLGDPASIEYEQAQRDLDLQEEALRQAMLDGDMEAAKAALEGIKKARAAVAQAYKDYSNLVNPVYQEQIARAGQITENTQPMLDEIALREQGTIDAAYGNADSELAGTADLIGANANATAAAQEISGLLQGLFVEDATGSAVEASSVLAALEKSAVADVSAFAAVDTWRKGQQADIDDRQYANREQGAEQAIAELEQRQKLFEIEKQRSKLAHDDAMRRLQETGDAPYMDAIGFGQLTAETALFDLMTEAGIPVDRQMALRSILDEAWSNGVFEYEQFIEWMSMADNEGLDRYDTALPGGLTPAESRMLNEAMHAYARGRDSYNSLSASGGGGGSVGGAVYKRGKEAPDNRGNAAAARRGEGAYGARARRVAAEVNRIQSQYDVNFLGQWRALDATVSAGRSANSDHYSGGALDFSGSQAEMQRLANDLKSRPDVSFVKIHGSPPHVHVSFML